MALVIAANDYKLLRPLENAVNDGRLVEEALEKLGFEVFSETNRDLRRMRRALEDFQEDAAGADVALVYFSGHGVEINGDNRLLPIDADPASLERLKETSLPLEEVTEAVRATAKIGLIVLDACRNDPFGSATTAGRGAVALSSDVIKDAKPGLGRLGRAENILFSFSAAPGQTASDGAAGNSEFSIALAKFMPTDGLEIRSVLTLVQQEVYEVSRGKQLPYVESGLPKLFFAAASAASLPERDRLLLAMADITPDLRSEVERIALTADMPLAPLYAALITADGSSMAPQQRKQKLDEAAQTFIKVRADLRNFASSDPRVTALRKEAEAKLTLGAFDEARAQLAAAAEIDGDSREDLKQHFIERTLSEATTHYLAGGVSHAQLRYDLAIDDFGKAAKLYDEVSGFDLPDDARYQHALAYELIGTLQTTVGNLKAASDAYGSMIKAVERRVAAQPEVINHKRDLVIANNLLADVRLATGDVDGALSLQEAAAKTLNEIIAQDPQPRYLRDLGYNYNDMGDATRTAGRFTDALQYYRAGLKVSDYLATLDPGDDGLRRDLGVSHSKIGLVQRFLGVFEDARAQYETSLSISEALAKKQPDNMELQRDIMVSLQAIGDIQRQTGDNQGAFAPYNRSVEIARSLTERDPGNTLWRRDLSVGLGKLGDAQAVAGDVGGALASYRSSLALVEYLSDLDPANAEWKRDVSVGQNKVGDALLSQKDTGGAIAAYEAGLVIAEAMRQERPQDIQRNVDAGYSHERLGAANRAAGNLKEALAEYQTALQRRIVVAELDPANAAAKRNIAIVQNLLGDVFLDMSNHGSAAGAYQAGLAIVDAARVADPTDVQAVLDVAYGRFKLALAKVEPKANLEAALALLKGLQKDGKLPPANLGWIDAVEVQLKKQL